MDEGRQWKRRRLDQPGLIIATSKIPDLSASPSGDISRGCRALSVCTGAATCRAVETAGTGIDNSANASIVCYGMLENLPILSIPTAAILDNPALVSAYLNEDGIVQRSSDGACVGKIEDRALNCLFKINNEDRVEIQFMLKTVTSQICKKRAARLVGLASAIIYGPQDLGDDVGYFLDRCNYFLQDPFRCERNVPYNNPHCISTLFETPRMTFDLRSPDLGTHGFTVSDSLQALETTGNLPEWPQPAALKTGLHPHQKQALRFFIDREGPKKVKHIWQSSALLGESPTYVNDVTGSSQTTSPPEWNGGILADEMGLGKTLEMISLIAVDRELQWQSREDQFASTTSALTSTLVVVPRSLIGVWEYQMNYHLHPSTITWGRHHRKSRLMRGLNAKYPDVVFTTYQTVQAEYKFKDRGDSILFRHKWRRVILDEAHIIRNKTATSSSLMALRAISRWAVTGTPIQNSFADIGGLLRFLRFAPYDSAKSFDEDILEFFRQGHIEEGARRLKALCHPIMIRRSMSIISLPPRQDCVKTIEFATVERREYEKIETALWQLPSDETSDSSKTRPSMNTFQLINRLRRFCNLGVCSILTPIVSWRTDLTIAEQKISVNTAVASEVALGGTVCKECGQILDNPNSRSTVDSSSLVYYSECCTFYCGSCAELSNYQMTARLSCCKERSCLLRPLSPKVFQEAGNEQPLPDIYPAETSKIRALVQEILSSPLEKSVVFSFWTSSLTSVQKALTTARICCLRIDGSDSLLSRERTIQEFRENGEIKVILVSISCGGVGLDLTAASRAHLLEPQWNPAVEEQALSRVHRMGQRRAVVTMRYIMKDSIEESVASVKGKKQLLAELLPRTAALDQQPDDESS
ncbi:hypothetical protein F5Y08DRAFT_302014 [Xylaria arbuscula]|nr:hypothetical protein F5Y08DRAFT_302014 [Xylaria arbuscula]